jgi:hypothetical protein
MRFECFLIVSHLEAVIIALPFIVEKKLHLTMCRRPFAKSIISLQAALVDQ